MLIEKKVLYVAEVASLLGCCSQVVYQLIEAGRICAYKEEGRKCWRIPVEALEEYISILLIVKRALPIIRSKVL